MARGNAAKEWAAKKIIECFGQNAVIEHDKKLYINTTEDGMPIQVCIAMTCPKTMVASDGVAVPVEPPKSAFSSGFDFSDLAPAATAPVEHKVAEITDSERETVADLLRKLGL